MRKVDAPPAGWYPDPDHRQRLRWWDGLDWTEIKRAPPSDAELLAAEESGEYTDHQRQADLTALARQQAAMGAGAPVSRQDVQQIIGEVRQVARSEIDRAAQEFSHRANTAVRSVTPLITEYTNTAVKWIKRAVVIAIVLLVAYFVFQVVVQASFFEWLGDRIDNWTDNEDSLSAAAASGLAVAPHGP